MPLILDSPGPSTPDKSRSTSPMPTPAARETRRTQHHEADVVIVGAGIAGSAAAVAFARQGRSVILLERSLKEPDRIVGELLQPGGVRALQRLGLAECLEGIDAVPNLGYEVFYHGRTVHIPYALEVDKKTGRKERPQGRCFHHGRFVRRLREAAMREADVTVVETTATGLVKDGWTGQILGVECTTKGYKDYYFGALTIVADGYASKFREQGQVQTKPMVRSKFYGLELHDCNLPRKSHGHVVISNAAPILLYQIGSNETRILIDVPEGLESARPQFGGVKGYCENVVLKVLPDGVQDSFKEALAKGGLRSMPNSFLRPTTNKVPGMIIVGDALNMRHPLTGGGMTVAFNDIVLLTELLSPEHVPRLDNTRLVLKQMRSFHWQRKFRVSVVNILAMALYTLFAASDPTLTILQSGCFNYFLLGGECVDGPVSLLGAINTNPLVLIYHFFAVAMYGIWIHFCNGFKKGLFGAIGACFWVLFGGPIYVIYRAAVVIGQFIVSEMKS